ncbi:MAG TPA: hypothetical protein DEQ01_00055 [Thermoanaerobacter sp.]|nr:hypothetical protein [Thermoanaerobacter sp.]
MNEGAVLISCFGFFFILASAFIIFKGTIFDITHIRNNPWPLLWYLQVLLTLFPLIIVSALGINNIPILYVAQSGLEIKVALATIFSMLLYILTLGFFLRFFGLSYRKYYIESSIFNVSNVKLYTKALELAIILSLIGLLLIVIFNALDYKHAFLYSIFKNTSLLQVRLNNKYNSLVPSQIASMLFIIGYILSVLAGYLGKFGTKKSFLYLAIAIFILSAPGDKAPVAYAIILWIFGRGIFLPKSIFSIRRILITAIVLIILSLGVIYFALSLQSPGLTPQIFVKYLLNRLGVGQMAGLYETFGLIENNAMPKEDYYWHMIPFASFFVDYIDYQKLLMMVTENVGYAQMGVKNTYFLAEAYAIGGPILAFISPIIVGFTTALGLYILLKSARFFMGGGLSVLIAIPIYLKTHNITGGFSSFPFLKGMIMLMFQLMVLWCLWLIIHNIVYRKHYIR